jgi:hypothetical protein
MIPWTELALARQQHLVPVGQEPDYAAVNAAYRHIMEKFPGHLAAKEAFLYLQSIQLAKLEPQSTRAAARSCGVRRPREEGIPQPRLVPAGRGLPHAQRAGKRLHAEKTPSKPPRWIPPTPSSNSPGPTGTSPPSPNSKSAISPSPARYYNLLLEKYPTDIRVYGCKQALERMDALEAKIRAEEEGL